MKNIIINILAIFILTSCSNSNDDEVITLPKELIGKWKATEVYIMYDFKPPSEFLWEDYNSGKSYDIEFKKNGTVIFYDVSTLNNDPRFSNYTIELNNDHIYFKPDTENDPDCSISSFINENITNDLLELDENNLKVLWRYLSLEFNETKYIKVD